MNVVMLSVANKPIILSVVMLLDVVAPMTQNNNKKHVTSTMSLTITTLTIVMLSVIFAKRCNIPSVVIVNVVMLSVAVHI